MKKIISMLIAMMVLAVSLVSATPPTFEVHKYTSITGDWKWEGNWQNGDWETATYQYDVTSQTSLSNFYGENEVIGNPWEYNLQTSILTTAPTETWASYNAWTVNDPLTTPATGGYSQFGFSLSNYGDFGESHLVISGEGAIDINTYLNAQTGVQQDVEVTLN